MDDQKCITCQGEGHAYLDCPRLSFGSMMSASSKAERQ